ncbi:MAG: hypothetical protein RIQ55_991 [Pseudomonadota bacterium]|jgi:hypothetical protein
MDISKLTSLVPDRWPHSVFDPFEKKAIAEHVVQALIDQIKDEARNPTQCELDSIFDAIVAIRAGMYALGVNSAVGCFARKGEVSKPDDWWDETQDHQALDKLHRELAQLKGHPPRGCFKSINL